MRIFARGERVGLTKIEPATYVRPMGGIRLPCLRRHYLPQSQ